MLADRRAYRSILLCAALIVAVFLPPANAANFSFEGSFNSDDDLRVFTLNVAAPSTVTFLTLSYGGGVNADGAAIAGGGFDPILSLFTGANDPGGTQLASNNDGTCPPLNNDAVTGACWDSLIEIALGPGLYTLVLSQSDNVALGPALGDGFLRAGQGNFTGPAFLGVPGSFIDANPSQRDSRWAVDILNAESAAVVPEPATPMLVSGCAVVFAAISRSRRRANRTQ